MMVPSTQRLVEAAAAPTLERIRSDRERAPHQVKTLLAYLEVHLFDPDLDAKRLYLACGIRDHNLSLDFHAAVGQPTYTYIESCRLAVACRLLRGTDMRVWQIGQLLGYSMLQVFSRAFERWSGLRPMVYRRRAAEVPEKTEVVCAATLRRAVRGELEREEADELARQLAGLYPESFIPAVVAPSVSRGAS